MLILVKPSTSKDPALPVLQDVANLDKMQCWSCKNLKEFVQETVLTLQPGILKIVCSVSALVSLMNAQAQSCLRQR